MDGTTPVRRSPRLASKQAQRTREETLRRVNKESDHSSAAHSRKSGARKLSKYEQWAVYWFIVNGLTHYFLEGTFLYVTFTETVEKSDSVLAVVWKEYGKADSRWVRYDAGIVSLELLTVIFCGTLCFYLINAIHTRSKARHYWQTVLCVCELYGGWMTFAPEWVDGSPNLDTSTFLFKWVYLFWANFVWVIIPLILLWESYLHIVHGDAHANAQKAKHGGIVTGILSLTVIGYVVVVAYGTNNAFN